MADRIEFKIDWDPEALTDLTCAVGRLLLDDKEDQVAAGIPDDPRSHLACSHPAHKIRMTLIWHDATNGYVDIRCLDCGNELPPVPHMERRAKYLLRRETG